MVHWQRGGDVSRTHFPEGSEKSDPLVERRLPIEKGALPFLDGAHYHDVAIREVYGKGLTRRDDLPRYLLRVEAEEHGKMGMTAEQDPVAHIPEELIRPGRRSAITRLLVKVYEIDVLQWS